MKVENLNSVLRDVINQLVADGYRKKPICDGTLGSQSNPQFDGFIKGKDLGIKPLSRLLDGLGYEILTIPVRKDDKVKFQWVTEQMVTFAQDSKSQLIQYLENRPNSDRQRNSEGTMTSALQDGVSQILNKLDQL